MNGTAPGAPAAPDAVPDAVPPGTGAGKAVGTAHGTTLGTRDWLALAVCAGVGGGVLEWLVSRTIKPFGLHTGVDFEPHSLWMIPAAQAVYCCVIAALLAIAARAVPRWVGLRAFVFVLSFVVLLSAGMRYTPTLSRKALAVLVLGVAVQCARMAAKRGDAFRAGTRRWAPRLVAAVAAAAAGVHAWYGIPAWLASRNLPAPDPAAPNVLLVILDTVRAQSVSHCGHTRETTPRLDAYARTGATFRRAIAPSSWTLPTHATLFTGRHFGEVGVGFEKPLDERHQTLAEALASRGYATAGFAANPWYCTRGSGLERGFAHYEDFEVGVRRFLWSPRLWRNAAYRIEGRGNATTNRALRSRAPGLTDAALRWIDGVEGRPFFAFLNYYDAHDPYEPRPPFRGRFADPDALLRPLEAKDPGPYPPATLQLARDRYEEAIAGLDADIGTLLDDLRARGVLERTLVIVAADHGEEFAEHGVLEHAWTLYTPSLHVPLVVSFPGRIPPGVVVDEPVALADLGATILDVTGARGAAPDFPGVSLAPWWTPGAAPVPAPVLSQIGASHSKTAWWPAGLAGLRSVVLDGYHYIRSDGDRPEELYHWTSDPWEERDLAKSPEHADALVRCRRALDEGLAR